MEPILGAGIMASKTPRQPAAMAHDFTSHLSFGFGIFLGVVIFRTLFGGSLRQLYGDRARPSARTSRAEGLLCCAEPVHPEAMRQFRTYADEHKLWAEGQFQQPTIARGAIQPRSVSRLANKDFHWQTSVLAKLPTGDHGRKS